MKACAEFCCRQIAEKLSLVHLKRFIYIGLLFFVVVVVVVVVVFGAPSAFVQPVDSTS